MSGWLELWQQSASGRRKPMAWMGDEGPMPGMATDAEITALNTVPVAQVEAQWLRLIIRHHRGAIPMADVAAAEASNPQVTTFVRNMTAGQQGEVDLMPSMLARRGFSQEPEGPDVMHGSGQDAAPAFPASSPCHDGH